MASPTPSTLPIQHLRTVQGFRCRKRDCTATHFVCPGCGREASYCRHKVPEIFSATCHETGELFLIDNRTWERKQ